MEPRKDHLTAGTLIAERFRIESLLGEGGMADVYATHDQETKKPIALKLLKPEFAANEEAVFRFKREAEVLRNLNHRAVVSLETFGTLPDGRIFIAMELLEGETLGELVRRKKVLSPHELAPVITGACAGLAAAHKQGIVHRDLKPDNIFLASEGNEIQVKLLDFGISKVYGSGKLTQTGEVLGTPRYMAPEQLAAERDLDGRTDVYALGVIAYEALAGTPPFVGNTATDLIVSIIQGKYSPLRSHVPDISAELEEAVCQAIATARETRFRDATDFATAYLDALTPNEMTNIQGRPNLPTEVMGSVDPSGLTTNGPEEPTGSTPNTLSEHSSNVSQQKIVKMNPTIATPERRAQVDLELPLHKGSAGSEPAAMRPRWPEASTRESYSKPISTDEYVLPVRKNHWPLFFIALVAGALFAGIAILVWNPFSNRTIPEPPPTSEEVKLSMDTRG